MTFDRMTTRWYYLDSEYLIADHPETGLPILVLRRGREDEHAIRGVLKTSQMELVSPLITEEGQSYYRLQEAV